MRWRDVVDHTATSAMTAASEPIDNAASNVTTPARANAMRSIQ